jgi:oligoendopeptidase F
MATTTETGAEAVSWDLGRMYAGVDDPAYARDADRALEDARSLRERYAGRLTTLDGPALAAAIEEFERITALAYRVRLFAALEFAAQASEERGAALQRAQERETLVNTELLFFELEWAALEDDEADAFLEDSALDRYRYALATRRRLRPYLLSEAEERIAAEKSITGIDTWRRLHTELLSRLRVRLDEREVALAEATSMLETLTDREERRRTSEAIGVALEEDLRLRAFVLNTVVNDRAIEDRMRGYPTWISAFNLAHQISDSAVEALVETVVGRYEVAHRHFRLRARLLGLDRLATYDVYAPVSSASPTIPWAEAKALVLDAYEAFSPLARDVVAAFFEEHRIDAAVREGKTQGAFCTRPVAGAPSYVLMSFTGNLRSVSTLAHELGHGLHGMLAEPQGFLNGQYPLTIAETASVFGEALAYDRLRSREQDERVQLDLLLSQIDTLVRTALLPIAGNRFENALHTARRAEGELSVARINELWVEQLRAYYGDAVERPEEREAWWSSFPHFAAAPGYMYPYSFGVLLAFSIYRRWAAEGGALVEPILDFLRAGASKSPEELARGVGADLRDPAFWNDGLDAIEELVSEAERLAARL